MMPWTSQAAQEPAGFADAATEVAEVISVLAPFSASRLKPAAAEHDDVGVIALAVAVVPLAAAEPLAHSPTASINAAVRAASIGRRRARPGWSSAGKVLKVLLERSIEQEDSSQARCPGPGRRAGALRGGRGRGRVELLGGLLRRAAQQCHGDDRADQRRET